MRTVVPDFYGKFVCKAGNCQHSCCRAHWEIDVDEATAQRYFVMPDPLGKELRENIYQNQEGYHLKKRTDGSCPFFQENGLCRLVLAMGEDCLCDICALHPRFFGLLATPKGDVELGGVGLCCEKSCELLLDKDKALQFYFLDEKNVTFSLGELLPRLGITLKGTELRFKPNFDQAYIQQVLILLAKTEPIDEEWTKYIKTLQKAAGDLGKHLSLCWEDSRETREPGILFDKIFQYIFYRQLEKITTFSAEKLLAFAQLNTEFVFLGYVLTGNLQEALRRWSEQIEYDEDNVEYLFSTI